MMTIINKERRVWPISPNLIFSDKDLLSAPPLLQPPGGPRPNVDAAKKQAKAAVFEQSLMSCLYLRALQPRLLPHPTPAPSSPSLLHSLPPLTGNWTLSRTLPNTPSKTPQADLNSLEATLVCAIFPITCSFFCFVFKA